MLCDDPTACETLRRVVCGLCPGGPFDEDLMQEGLIRLWTLEEQQPGQSLSWYLQGCRFHLLNQLAAGRSLDSGNGKEGACRSAPGRTRGGFSIAGKPKTRSCPKSVRPIFLRYSCRGSRNASVRCSTTWHQGTARAKSPEYSASRIRLWQNVASTLPRLPRYLDFFHQRLAPAVSNRKAPGRVTHPGISCPKEIADAGLPMRREKLL